MTTNELISQIDSSLIKSVSDTVSTFKIQKAFNKSIILPINKYKKIEEVIGFYELAIVNQWEYALNVKKEDILKKNEFIQLCKTCFSLRAYPKIR